MKDTVVYEIVECCNSTSVLVEQRLYTGHDLSAYLSKKLIGTYFTLSECKIAIMHDFRYNFDCSTHKLKIICKHYQQLSCYIKDISEELLYEKN